MARFSSSAATMGTASRLPIRASLSWSVLIIAFYLRPFGACLQANDIYSYDILLVAMINISTYILMPIPVPRSLDPVQ